MQGLVVRLGVALLDGVQEDTEEQSRDQDTDGIGDRRVVNGSTLRGLGVDQLAEALVAQQEICLLYTSPSPRDCS